MFVTIIMVFFRWILWCSSCPAFLWLSVTHSLLQSFIVLQVWTFFPKIQIHQVASASFFLERKYWCQIGPLKKSFIECHLSKCEPNAAPGERAGNQAPQALAKKKVKTLQTPQKTMNTNKEAAQTLAHKKVEQHKRHHKHRTHTTQTRRSKQHRERKAPHSSECTDTTHQNNINKTRLTSSVQRRNVCDVSLQSQQNTKLDNLTTWHRCSNWCW